MKNKIFGLLFLLQIAAVGQKITKIKINENGRLAWATIGETKKLPFVIEHFSWNRWVKVGEVDGLGTPSENLYEFKVAIHSGENLVRVSQGNPTFVLDSVKINCNVSPVTYAIEKKAKEIRFSQGTMFEIYNSSNILVKKGFADFVSYENLPKGNYILNFDNQSDKFKK